MAEAREAARARERGSFSPRFFSLFGFFPNPPVAPPFPLPFPFPLPLFPFSPVVTPVTASGFFGQVASCLSLPPLPAWK